MKAPVRVLSKARDLYVKSLTDCSERMPYGAAMGCPSGFVYTLPRSFSVNSSTSREDEDRRALVHTLSKDSNYEEDKAPRPRACGSKGLLLAKSYSVEVIGRIDEESPCNFSEDLKVDLFVRDRSYAVSKKR